MKGLTLAGHHARKTVKQLLNRACGAKKLTWDGGETMFRMNNSDILHIPRDPITLSKDDWDVQSPPQQSI